MFSSDSDIDGVCDSRSPQMAQSFPSSGFRTETHSSQTGNREMFVRKALQRRHSEGKIVANRLSAMPRSQDAGSLSRAALSVATARVRSPVLLKTNLPRPGKIAAQAARRTRRLSVYRRGIVQANKRGNGDGPVCAAAEKPINHRGHGGSRRPFRRFPLCNLVSFVVAWFRTLTHYRGNR